MVAITNWQFYKLRYGIIFFGISIALFSKADTMVLTDTLGQPVTTKNQTLTQIELRSDSFINPNYDTTGDKSFGFFGARYNNLPQSTQDVHDASVNADISSLFSTQQPVLSYVNVSELYFSGMGLVFGRKKETWSYLDEQWQLGFFQPQFTWNPLLPESQGLTGFFLDINDKDSQSPLGLRLFGSFLYLPSQGPGYQLQNGQFQSINPWFQRMPSQLEFDSNSTVYNNLYWNVQTPDMSKLIFNSSFLARLYSGREDDGFFIATSAGYKPSNQLLLTVNSETTASSQTNITVIPEVYYHSLAAVDLHYSKKSFLAGAGYLSEKPTQPESLPANFSYRYYNSREMLSPYVGYQGERLNATVAYLQIQGDQDIVQGPQANYLSSYLPQQLGFGNAWKLDVSYRVPRSYLSGIGTALKLTSSYMQGLDNEFAMWVNSADLTWTRQWNFKASVLLVQADPNSATASLFAQYQNNDMVTMEAVYGF